jgi:hypothetical protein
VCIIALKKIGTSMLLTKEYRSGIFEMAAYYEIPLLLFISSAFFLLEKSAKQYAGSI